MTLQRAVVEEIPLHGGSLHLSIAREESAKPETSVEMALQKEEKAGMDRMDFYAEFARRVGETREKLRSLLESIRKEGKTVAAYGAAAKGTVLMNYCGIGPWIEFVADRSPYKQGLYVPGVQLPIFPPARLMEKRPDYTLILPWNIADEIMTQLAEYRRRGGRFIIPIPEPKVV